jgi:hypothetical protein
MTTGGTQKISALSGATLGVCRLNRRLLSNNNGGGIYTIKTTQPSREAAIAKLQVGDSITVNVSPVVATSVAKCGLFGKGLFGC